MRIRIALTTVMLATLVLGHGSARADSAGCTPGKNGCLPTPEQCQTGLYNGHWDGGYPTRFADCVGGAGHVVHYAGGDLDTVCGAIIDADQIVAGDWMDPNPCTRRDTPHEPGPGRRFRGAIRSAGGVVAAPSTLAAQVGRDILAGGGNAIDAAVATVFTLSVTRPAMTGLGGGGYLVYREASGASYALDFMAAAPAATTPTSFQGPGLDRPLATGHRIVGVPGVVAGLSAAIARFGSMPLGDVIAPAEQLARDGVVVTSTMASEYGYGYELADLLAEEGLASPLPFEPLGAKGNVARFQLFPATRKAFLKYGLLPYVPGELLVQPDLANSLALIAQQGPDAFYQGAIAHLIADEMERSRTTSIPGDEGLMTLEDLAAYQPVWHTPLNGTYRGYDIVAIPPSSAGGVQTLEVLNILEGFDLAGAGYLSADHLHLLAEAEKIAVADAQGYLGDPNYVDNPTATLTSKEYASARRAEIDLSHAQAYGAGVIDGQSATASTQGSERGHTAHVSVVDGEGNAVSVTTTVDEPWGSGVVAPGTGFILNDIMIDFNQPGSPQEAGPGRRPLMAMTPLIVAKDGKAVLVDGAAGGVLIPSAVIEQILNVVDFGMDLGQSIDAVRMFERMCCDMQLEQWRVPSTTLDELAQRGHSIVALGEYCFCVVVQLAGTDLATGEHVAATDPRDAGENGAAGE